MRKCLLLFLLLALPLHAQNFSATIDKSVAGILKKTGAPSASIAVVREGKIAYVKAYGLARLQPPMPAISDMRYSIGSISKQFTAAAILMLAQQGKISLDDKIVRWFPDLTRSNEVTVREILSMTSGYQDFWPQDYVMPGMLQPTDAQQIMDQWARKPLDFDPGTKWQYSNTNFVIAGAIVEKITGMPLLDFLRQNIFGPLHMTSVYNSDQAPLGPNDPQRYLRYALGPLRPAPKEGKGWMFAAGELAMTAHDLALWDISMMDQSILQPASYREMETEVELRNGVGTHYGLGVGVGMSDGRRYITHGGEVSGFTATNTVYPDDRAAIVVQTNLDATGASSEIASAIAKELFTTTDKATEAALAEVKGVFDHLQHGQIDRSLFSSNANAYFTDQAIADFASGLGPLGKPQSFTQASQGLRGGMTLRRYAIKFPQKMLYLTTFWLSDGKLEQYQIAAAE